jgi:membrane protein required for colicin V production
MILDIIFALTGILLFVRGWKHGIIHAVVSLLGLLAGLMVAVRFSDLAATYLDAWFQIQSRYVPVIAFIAVFFGIFFLFRFIEKAMEGFFNIIKLNFLNQFLGGLVWLVIWAMLFSTILFYGNNMQLFSDQLKSESITYETLEPLAPQITAGIGKVIPPAKNIYHDLQQWFDTLEEKKRHTAALR